MARKRVAVVLVAAVEGRRRYNAAEMGVADLLVLAAHKPVVVPAVVERKGYSFVEQEEVADLRVLLPNKDPLSTRTNCTRNEADVQKEIHRLLYRVQQDLHRCSAGDARFGVAFRIEWVEESWFGSGQAWNLQEFEE